LQTCAGETITQLRCRNRVRQMVAIARARMLNAISNTIDNEM